MSSSRIGEAGEMEDNSVERRWEKLENDVLVKIFLCFDLFELISSGFGHVCSSWRKACCDPLIWKMLDLSMLKSNFIIITCYPYVYVASRSHKELTRLLKISLSLSQGSITSMFFHFNLYLSDEQFTYTAERTPRLRRLVLPAWDRIEEATICKAIRMWKDLESLAMPTISKPVDVFREIANNCENFSELKVMGPFDVFFAKAIVTHLPKLRVLSLRCTAINKDALILILDGLQLLEVLNISHSLIVEVQEEPNPNRVIPELDQNIKEKASRLSKFLTCMKNSCVMCRRNKEDEGLMRWYKYEEGLWKADEVSSLAF